MICKITAQPSQYDEGFWRRSTEQSIIESVCATVLKILNPVFPQETESNKFMSDIIFPNLWRDSLKQYCWNLEKYIYMHVFMQVIIIKNCHFYLN